jgi:hypothetical protein
MSQDWIERLGKSDKAREKFADHLMAARTGLAVALFASISISLMLGLAKRIGDGATPLRFKGILSIPSDYPVESSLWLFFCLVAFAIIYMLGESASQIYDSLESMGRIRSRQIERKSRWSKLR